MRHGFREAKRIITPVPSPPSTLGSPPARNVTLLSPGCARSTEHPPLLQIALHSGLSAFGRTRFLLLCER
ncbi:hypothetical protein NQZ68_031429 [Dissostichus eleginoides]|nr:hypothetical protein NQZ68_031429 [Dissostichus eleginoides]